MPELPDISGIKSLEQGAIAALFVVVGALAGLYRMDRKASLKREQDCNARASKNEKRMRRMLRHMGRLEASVLLIKGCTTHNCPMSSLTLSPSENILEEEDDEDDENIDTESGE